jgi:hypothetical protein
MFWQKLLAAHVPSSRHVSTFHRPSANSASPGFCFLHLLKLCVHSDSHSESSLLGMNTATPILPAHRRESRDLQASIFALLAANAAQDIMTWDLFRSWPTSCVLYEALSALIWNTTTDAPYSIRPRKYRSRCYVIVR